MTVGATEAKRPADGSGGPGEAVLPALLADTRRFVADVRAALWDGSGESTPVHLSFSGIAGDVHGVEALLRAAAAGEAPATRSLAAWVQALPRFTELVEKLPPSGSISAATLDAYRAVLRAVLDAHPALPARWAAWVTGTGPWPPATA